jgi:hypothetical protein
MATRRIMVNMKSAPCDIDSCVYLREVLRFGFWEESANFNYSLSLSIYIYIYIFGTLYPG